MIESWPCTVFGSKVSKHESPVPETSLPCRLVVFAMCLALTPSAPAGAVDSENPIGAVYVASNEFSGNRILTFLVSPDGSLTPAGPGVSTGGLGSGPYSLGFPVTDDPLASSNSLIVDQEHKLLFAANAGSDEVSVLAIDPQGLTLVDLEPSGGIFPVSLAFRDGTLYVLNAVDNSLAVFHVDDGGQLTLLQVCPLPDLPPGADPILPGDENHSPQPVNSQTVSQVGLSPDGRKLVVVSKEGALIENFPLPPLLGNGRIYVYDLDNHDHTVRCGDPTITVLPSNSQDDWKWPFSFAWSQEGQLLLTEVFGAETSLAGSAVSSFQLRSDGSLTPISVSVGNGQGAMCWIVCSGAHAYATNFANDNLSSYSVAPTGEVTLADSMAITFGPGFQEFPIDMVLTRDGRFIYQLTPGSAHVRPFEIDRSTGALTALMEVPDGLDPHSGQAGIATVDFRLEMAFDFKPHGLNLDSNDRWVTAYLRPPAPYSAPQIDVASIRLNDSVPVSTERPPVLLANGKLRVEFLRSEVAPTLTLGDHVLVTVTGTVADEAFLGIDSIKVRAADMQAPQGGEQLSAGDVVQIAWDPPDGEVSVTLLFSADDGVSWRVEAQDIPNTGSYSWPVPAVSTDRARLEVVAVFESDETRVVPEEEYAVSGAFTISTPTGVEVGDASFSLRTVNPVVGPLAVSFSLPSSDPASLVVFDVGGRKVAAREVDSSGPGWHTAKLGSLPAGVYVVQLSQSGHTRSARVVVLR